MHGDDYLATIGVAPFLVTSLLAYLPKAVPPQHPNDIFGTANRKALAHLSATSSTFAPAGNVTGAGSNQRSTASLAFRTASSSVSPAEAHPGNSGKNAAQRLVWGSCSSTSRSFMEERITLHRFSSKPQMSNEPFVLIETRSAPALTHGLPPIRPLGFPIYVARCHAAPFTRCYPYSFTFYLENSFPRFVVNELCWGSNEGTLRAFRYADRFPTFKIVRRPGAL